MTCQQRYYRPGDDWHTYPCDRPAKFRVFTNRTGEIHAVCGIHVRRYQKSSAFTVESL